ncbi:MAG: geranylgeranylglyceryl/heptaprenylglyceryl phosphate synthase [Symbiobacteriia bacterium]
MNPEAWKSWRVVAKVDPDKPLLPEHIATLREGGLDAVVLGGTQGITQAKVAAARAALAATGLPLAVEVSTLEAVLPDAALFLIPIALNAGDATWITGAHQEAVRRFRGLLDWSRLVAEGYLVLNPDSAVARVTAARCPLPPEEAVAYAELGARLFHLPLIYLEYSGVFGSPEVVAACARAVAGSGARLFYGGGIQTPEQAAVMARLVDTLVVGNLVQSPNHRALTEIVRTARGCNQTIKLS